MEEMRPDVLVVDDYADAADSMVLLLGLWGYRAEACRDGPSGLARARARPPGAVLLDIGMPRMDGFRFMETFRGLPRCGGSLVIAITGHTSPAYRKRARDVGIDHYLPKPVDLDLLESLLEGMAGRLTPRREYSAAVEFPPALCTKA